MELPFIPDEVAREFSTPIFIYDHGRIIDDTERALRLIAGERTELLFAMKSFTIAEGLEILAARVGGFHASSLFEARLARKILGEKGVVHLTTPALRSEDMGEIAGLCDMISFNSIGQMGRFAPWMRTPSQCGIRLNPGLSFVDDERYDPCRRHSKLGIHLEELENSDLQGVRGLLLHGNCDSEDFLPLLSTVLHMCRKIPRLLERLEWINLGGGYLFGENADPAPLQEALQVLRAATPGLILFEPGAALVRGSGFIVASVVDLFIREGKRVAVLDTSINHMPEVFEYQYPPEVAGTLPSGGWSCILTGATCLAGDLFGEYDFPEPLQIGSPVVFTEVGAYSLVKANMFNGVNLPDILSLNRDGELTLQKHHGYDDFLERCGGSHDHP